MRMFAVAAIVLGLATPALAQNASQIAAVAKGASCPGCNLFQADLSRKELRAKNYAGARFRQSDFTAATLSMSNFSGGDLRDLNAYGALMTGVNFSRTDLTNASFVGAYLEGASFAGANLTGVNFSGAELGRARGLTQAQLAKACGDATTILPRGLSLRRC